MISQSLLILVPIISARISDGGKIATAGHSYTLTCSVTGTKDLNPAITYEWTKRNSTQTNVVGSYKTLTFSSLRLSDAGEFFCCVTVNSHHRNAIGVTSSYHIQIQSK